MTRVTDALLAGKAFSQYHAEPMLDLTYGGQMGYTPVMAEWVNNQAYVRKNLICFLMEAPQAFNYLPNSDKWVQVLKALVEKHPRTIEGLNAALTAETGETPVGGGGEMQEEVTNMTRARTQLVMTFDEKYGRPIQNFLEAWMQMLLMDPDSKVAGIGTLASFPTDMLADQYAATMLFIEPDPTHRKVMKAWLTTNIFPKETGPIEGKRDITAAGELLSLSIPFAGFSQSGAGVKAFAQRIFDTVNITGSNPNLRNAFVTGISADVNAAARGYKEGAEAIASNSVASS